MTHVVPSWVLDVDTSTLSFAFTRAGHIFVGMDDRVHVRVVGRVQKGLRAAC